MHLWAALAVGFCLAAHEMRLYTAIYQYQGPTLEGLLVSISFVTLIFALAALFFRKVQRSILYVAVFAALTAFQKVAIIAQDMNVIGLLPDGIRQVCAPLGECYSLGLVIIAVSAARVFGERSVVTFIGGFAISGLLQLITALLKWEIAVGLIGLFPLAALLCFAVFIRLDRTASQSRQNSAADDANNSSYASIAATADEGISTWHLTRGESAAILFSFFLMGALLISTHATRMNYQDGGSYSMAIQILSGFGGIAAAILLRALDRKLTGMTRLALVYLLVLPILLVALYAASLFENIAVLALLVFFHRFVYGLVYYFVWLLCTTLQNGTHTSDRFVASFFALKLGWAAGVLFFMIMPTETPEGFWSVVLIGFFFALGLIDVFLFLKMLHTAEKGIRDNGAKAGEVVSSDLLGYEEACCKVAESYGLTKREAEVLRYLGKGRTAAYIREKMFISDGTARTHIDHIYKKLGIHSQQALIDIIDHTNSSHQQ